MRQPIALLAFLATSLTAAAARGEDEAPGSRSSPRRYSIGTSLFMLANLVPDDYPAVFAQLNVGYQLTPRDRLSAEAITWRYYHPLGIPWGEARYSVEHEYPGHIREYGIGLAYQRLLWKGVYSSISAVPFWRQYYDTQDTKIGNGFELFVTLRLGYQLLFRNRVFVEPSVAFTWWPIATDVPDSFTAMDDEWPSYFLFEPGLHAGVIF
jgi:hypothetical protein